MSAGPGGALTRRDALRAGALAAAAAALPAPAARAAADDADLARDLAAVTDLLRRERRAADAYAAASQAPQLSARVRRLAATFAAHGRERVAELAEALEERDAPASAFPGVAERLAVRSDAAALRAAAGLERAAVAACHEALGTIDDRGLAALVAAVMAGRAQQLGAVRLELGADPSPAPFETGARVE